MVKRRMKKEKWDIIPWIVLFFIYITLSSCFCLYAMPGFLCVELIFHVISILSIYWSTDLGSIYKYLRLWFGPEAFHLNNFFILMYATDMPGILLFLISSFIINRITGYQNDLFPNIQENMKKNEWEKLKKEYFNGGIKKQEKKRMRQYTYIHCNLSTFCQLRPFSIHQVFQKVSSYSDF